MVAGVLPRQQRRHRPRRLRLANRLGEAGLWLALSALGVLGGEGGRTL